MPYLTSKERTCFIHLAIRVSKLHINARESQCEVAYYNEMNNRHLLEFDLPVNFRMHIESRHFLIF